MKGDKNIKTSKETKNKISNSLKRYFKDNPDKRIPNGAIDWVMKHKDDVDFGFKNLDNKKKASKAIGEKHLGQTYIEKKFRWGIENLGLAFEQQKFFRNNYRRFWVDFYLPSLNLIVECDGKYWHNKEQDKERDIQLRKITNGEVLHFTENEIRNQFSNVMGEIESRVGCFLPVPIKELKIRKIEKRRIAYNFTVEEDNSYILEGMVCHNCPICGDKCGAIYNLEGFQYPPVHPLCQCSFSPVTTK